MPKSFASSQFEPRHRRPAPRKRRACLSICALSLVTVLAAGCGGRKNILYSPADVQSAFAAENLSLYGPNQNIPSGIALEEQRAPSLRRTTQPLPALLDGIRDAVFLPALLRGGRPVVLSGAFMYVFVYPRAQQAQARARSFDDILAAEHILNRVNFGYALKGNVVVDYEVLVPGSRVPGFLGPTDNVRAFDRLTKRQIAAAFKRL
jgi:hypothetical protein